MSKRDDKFHLFICLINLAGIIIAGLWPFNFFPPNRVFWLQDKNGLLFQNPGIVFSEKPLFESQNSEWPSQLTFEIWLKPDEAPNDYLPAIIELWNPETSSLILVGQWKSVLVIRSYSEYFQGSGLYREIGLRDALLKDIPTFLTITSTQNQTFIYINGDLSQHYSNYSIIPGIPRTNSGSAYLVIGNSIYGKAAWSGEIYGLRIWDRQLSSKEISTNYQTRKNQDLFPSDREELIANYLFNARAGFHISSTTTGGPNLLIPIIYRPFKYSILSLIWHDMSFTRTSITDIITNILGFIPFGFFLAIFIHKRKEERCFRNYFVIILVGATLSLLIELAQVFLPTRHSQMIDVACNVFGSFLGVYLFRIFLSHFSRFRNPNFQL